MQNQKPQHNLLLGVCRWLRVPTHSQSPVARRAGFNTEVMFGVIAEKTGPHGSHGPNGGMLSTLSGGERAELAALEQKIEVGLQTFMEVGMALGKIRKSRLYRDTHETFEKYVEERWGKSVREAHRLIAAADVCQNLLPKDAESQGDQLVTLTLPTSESQVRPLAGLPAEEQRGVWEEAVTRAPEGQGPTAKLVQEVVEERKWPQPSGLGVYYSSKQERLEFKDSKEPQHCSAAINILQIGRSQWIACTEFRCLGWGIKNVLKAEKTFTSREIALQMVCVELRNSMQSVIEGRNDAVPKQKEFARKIEAWVETIMPDPEFDPEIDDDPVEADWSERDDARAERSVVFVDWARLDSGDINEAYSADVGMDRKSEGRKIRKPFEHAGKLWTNMGALHSPKKSECQAECYELIADSADQARLPIKQFSYQGQSVSWEGRTYHLGAMTIFRARDGEETKWPQPNPQGGYPTEKAERIEFKHNAAKAWILLLQIGHDGWLCSVSYRFTQGPCVEGALTDKGPVLLNRQHALLTAAGEMVAAMLAIIEDGSELGFVRSLAQDIVDWTYKIAPRHHAKETNGKMPPARVIVNNRTTALVAPTLNAEIDSSHETPAEASRLPGLEGPEGGILDCARDATVQLRYIKKQLGALAHKPGDECSEAMLHFFELARELYKVWNRRLEVLMKREEPLAKGGRGIGELRKKWPPKGKSKVQGPKSKVVKASRESPDYVITRKGSGGPLYWSRSGFVRNLAKAKKYTLRREAILTARTHGGKAILLSLVE